MSVPNTTRVRALMIATLLVSACAPQPPEWWSGEGAAPRADMFARVLADHVDDDGRVDYAGLRSEPDELDEYLDHLARVDLASMDDSQRMATLINAYNAFTLKLMIEHPDVKSIRDIPASKRWKDRRWNLGGRMLSLDELEHEIIRPATTDARIHFALVCASEGCPPLLPTPYTAKTLDRQLDRQASAVHRSKRGYSYDPERNVLRLTPLYRWYSGDFRKDAGSVLAFVSRYSPDVRAAIESGRPPRIEWMEYDWSLNDAEPGG